MNSFLKKEIKSYNKKISEIVGNVFSSENFKKNIETTSRKQFGRPFKHKENLLKCFVKKQILGESTPTIVFLIEFF